MLLAVTGATGFLGRAFVAAATRAGHQIRALVRDRIRANEVLPALGVELVEGELEQPAVAATLMAGADALVHLAALGVQGRDRDWERTVRVNALASLAWIAEAARAGVGQVVAAGTCLEYAGHGRLPKPRWAGPVPAPLFSESNPLEASGAYGASKAAAGILLRARARELDLPLWYLRFAPLYGPGDDPQKLLPAAMRAARENRPFEMTRGEQVRELLHIDDAVRALFATLERRGSGEINVGTGRGLTLAAVVGRLFEAAGADPSLLRLGARPYRPGEVEWLVMDVSRAKRELGFEAVV